MKKALISPNQLVYDYSTPPVALGYSVCQVESEEFPVAEPLFWADCSDEITSYSYYWNSDQFYAVPPLPVKQEVLDAGGPSVI